MSLIEDPVTFVVPGDLHLTEAGLDNHDVALRAIEEINTLIRPDFVQFIGDNVQDATEDQFRLFDDLRQRLYCPHFALVGDHDVKDDPNATGFRSHVGATFGSTLLRGFRFLRLDTQQSKPLGLSAEQIDWFLAEVGSAIASGERPVIFQHNYPFQIWENFDGPGIDDWRAIVQTNRITAIISGHTHYWQIGNDGRNVAVAVRSIGDPEGGPPGYLVGHLSGDDFAVASRTPGDPAPLVMVTHPREAILATGPAHVVKGADRLEVRTWSNSPVAKVSGRIDGGEWFPMEPVAPGRWIAPLPGHRLSKGKHRSEVRAIDGRGVEGRRTTEFAVDPTGRYTAVPRAVPLVEATEFC